MFYDDFVDVNNIDDVDIVVVLRVPSTAGCWGPNADLYTVTEISRHHFPETYVILHMSAEEEKMGQNVFLFVINKSVILFFRYCTRFNLYVYLAQNQPAIQHASLCVL